MEELEPTLPAQILPHDHTAILHARTHLAHQVLAADVLADTAAAEVAAVAAEDLAVAVEEDKSN